MNLAAVLVLAVTTLARNKTRSLLTALGIIIGVASVVTMVAVVQGAYNAVGEQIRAMGSNLIMIMPGSGPRHGAGPAGGPGTVNTLTWDDATVLGERCTNLGDVCPIVRASGQAVFANQNWPTSIMGTTASYLAVRAWRLAQGRFFSEIEARQGAKVCVLGHTVFTNLFGNVEPLGKMIRIKKIPFQVIGVLESRGETGMGGDQDDVILAPLAMVQKRMQGMVNIHMVMASARNDEAVEPAKEEITAILRHRHRLGAKEEDDFNIRTQADMAQMASSTLLIMGGLLGSIAGVSLLVGGIGIMNIMLVSVTERTREIGIRMAIGARGRDILVQFLVEAMVLSSLGGVAGIAAGFGGARLVTALTKVPTLVSWSSGGGAVLFSGLVGMFFGLYPAWKASRLDPIDALRFE